MKYRNSDMEVVYEVECQRTGISPRQFWSYCKRRFKEKTGTEFTWIDTFEDWENPLTPSDIRSKHEDWEHPLTEICVIQPMDYHLFLENNYNFIMEWFDGNGYMYAVEFKR